MEYVSQNVFRPLNSNSLELICSSIPLDDLFKSSELFLPLITDVSLFQDSDQLKT